MTKFATSWGVVMFFVVLANTAYAQSITQDLAKNCREQAIKAYPTPIAGTKSKGVAKAQRDFFEACIAKGSDKKQEK